MLIAFCVLHSDVVLLRGRCVAIERTVTGHDKTILKRPLEESDENDREFDVNGESQEFMLSAGTRLLAHNQPLNTEPGLIAPDNGAIGVVVRTGFNTEYGRRLRQFGFDSRRLCHLEPDQEIEEWLVTVGIATVMSTLIYEYFFSGNVNAWQQDRYVYLEVNSMLRQFFYNLYLMVT